MVERGRGQPEPVEGPAEARREVALGGVDAGVEQEVGQCGDVVGRVVLGGVGAFGVGPAGGVVSEQVAERDAEGVDEPLEHGEVHLGVRCRLSGLDPAQRVRVDAGALGDPP